MNKLFLIVGFILLSQLTIAQDYIKHTVKTGETVYSLTKKYNVSEAAIYQLNPDAKSGLSIGKVVIIPNGTTIANNENEFELEYDTHKVKRKETLYSLSKRFDVSVDDLKKHNPRLYAEPLKKGDVIKIPLLKEFETAVSTKDNDTVLVVKQSKITHIVVAKETKYGIAKQYGITVAELEKQNPVIQSGLKIGQELKIVKVEDIPTEDNGTPTNFEYYSVQEKDTFYSLSKSLGLTEEQIKSYNPKFSDGLKAGMLLKYPKEGSVVVEMGSTIAYSEGKTKLVDSIRNYDKKKLAIMLPFRLNQVPDSSRTLKKEHLETNRLLNATLDFYSGVLVAVDSLKSHGISTDLKVIDTENDYVRLSKKLDELDLSDRDAVIGPMFPKNLERVATVLEANHIPVISPISQRDLKLTSNTFQTIPSSIAMRDKMIEYLQKNLTIQNVVLITDSKSSAIKDLLKEKFPNLQVMMANDDEYVVPDHVKKRLYKEKENWVLVETQNNGLVVNVITAVNALKAKYDVKLFTTSSSAQFKNKDNYQLANLNFCFPSIDLEVHSDEEIPNPFVEKYVTTYGVTPNRFAIRGFDVTMDVLLRLSVSGNLMDSAMLGETEYVENRFNYMNMVDGGFYNNAFYIARYKEDLTIEKVE
ncbi:MAG: LysM peptidoglycan-binding domain-containing protein [Flavobacteriaceae bacterium]|nr:LysM peptidoglycan-binding domain-containing protein [Flavobacteriaceae bacterium]